jgi:hypothetical protein
VGLVASPYRSAPLAHMQGVPRSSPSVSADSADFRRESQKDENLASFLPQIAGTPLALWRGDKKVVGWLPLLTPSGGCR